MIETRSTVQTQRRDLWIMVAILLFGFFLRTTDVGANPLQGDEAWNSYLAYDWGHNGHRAELGLYASGGANFAPFFHDVFAIPFSFDPDPRIARLFMALIQLVSMPMLYWLVRRYWTARAALLALLLYSVMPRAVWAGRYLWNPYLALPFLVGFVATGLLIVEGKRWARWLHLPLLSCIIQVHPIGIPLALLSPILFAFDWRKHGRTQRRKLLAGHIIGAAFAALLMLPWVVGYVHQRMDQTAAGQLRLRNRTNPATILQYVIDNPTVVDVGSFGIPRGDYVQPSEPFATVYKGIGWFTLLGSFFVLGRGLFRRRLPDFIIAAAFLAVPVFSLLSPTRTYDHYMVLILPYAAIIPALVLTAYQLDKISNLSFRRLAQGVGAAVIAIIVLTEVAQVVNALEQIHNFRHSTRESMLSLDDMIKLRNEAVRPGYETLYLVEGSGTFSFTQALVWQMLANQGPSRVLWGDSYALPVPANGVTYVGYADATHIPELYGARPSRLTTPVYRVVDLPAGTRFTPSCVPSGPTRLSSGATILGYYVPQTSSPAPQPDQPWIFYLLWQGAPTSVDQSYQFFNHLVNDRGDRVAQSDFGALSSSLWRDGDQLVSRVSLTLPAQWKGGPLYLRVGMYTLPNVVNANALDDHGAPVGQWITIPVCQTF